MPRRDWPTRARARYDSGPRGCRYATFAFWSETLTSNIQVIVLGAGDAFGSGGRRQSSYLVRGGSSTFLMDAGPTVLAGLKDARCSSADIDFIALSHMHGDHFAGIPFLLMEYLYEEPRTRPLTIAGPAGVEERVRECFHAMYRQSSMQPLKFPLQFITMTADQPLRIGTADLEPFAVPHQENEPSLGMKIRVDGKVIVYSGDSGWTEEFVKRTEDVDLFLCECCYWDTNHWFHINYPELERNRARIRARRLVLSHLGREVLEKLDRVKEVVAHDGMVIDL